MTLVRRELLQIAGVLAAVPSATWTAFAQTAGPKLTQILKKDMEGQGLTVQETVVSIVEFPPGVSAPWHMHPSAQEMLYALDGNLVVEVDGRGTVSNPVNPTSYPATSRISLVTTAQAQVRRRLWCTAEARRANHSSSP